MYFTTESVLSYHCYRLTIINVYFLLFTPALLAHQYVFFNYPFEPAKSNLLRLPSFSNRTGILQKREEKQKWDKPICLRSNFETYLKPFLSNVNININACNKKKSLLKKKSQYLLRSTCGEITIVISCSSFGKRNHNILHGSK